MFGVYPLYRTIGDHAPANVLLAMVPADLPKALWLGTLGTIGFCAGSLVIPSERWQQVAARERPRVASLSATTLSLICLGLSLAAVWIFGSYVGGIGELFHGRRTDNALASAPGFLAMVPLSQAAVMVVLHARRAHLTGRARIVTLVSWLICIVLLSPLGNRRFIAPAVFCPLLARYIAKGSGLALKRALPVLAVAGMTLIAIPSVRSEGARTNGLLAALRSAVYENGGAVFKIVTAQNFEMVDALSAQVSWSEANHSGPHFGIDTATDFAFAIFPSPLIGVGAETTHDKILTGPLGSGCNRATGCPDVSFVGSLYWEFGAPGVLIGAYFFGLLARRYSSVLPVQRRSSTIAYRSVAIVFAPITVRAVLTPTGTLWVAMALLVFLADSALGDDRSSSLRASEELITTRHAL
jgi:hypothetical protein